MKRSIFAAGMMVILTSCSTTRTVTYSPWMEQFEIGSVAVGDIIVESRKAGDNIFTYDDRITLIMGGRSFVVTDQGAWNFSRAEFVYPLAQDPSPLIRKALLSIFSESSTSTRSLHATVPFAYQTAKYGDGMLKNSVEIILSAKLILKDNNKTVSEHSYNVSVQDKYSTAWTTFPSNKFMDDLFHKALTLLLSKIRADIHHFKK